MENFAQRLKKSLKGAGMTQEQLAQAVGISAAAVSYYIKGVNIPRAVTMKELAAALGVDADWLGGDMPFCKKLEKNEVKKVELPVMDIM